MGLQGSGGMFLGSFQTNNNYTSPMSSGTHSTSITVPLGSSSPRHSLRAWMNVGLVDIISHPCTILRYSNTNFSSQKK